jgi:hypothetical protein
MERKVRKEIMWKDGKEARRRVDRKWKGSKKEIRELKGWKGSKKVGNEATRDRFFFLKKSYI